MNAIAAAAEFQIRGSPPPTPPAGSDSQGSVPVREGSESAPKKQAAPEQQPPRQAVEQAADGVNAFLKSSGSHVQFALHQGTNQLMVQVLDDKTDEIIRTIPSKELLELADKVGEMVGMLLDKKG